MELRHLCSDPSKNDNETIFVYFPEIQTLIPDYALEIFSRIIGLERDLKNSWFNVKGVLNIATVMAVEIR